MERVGWLETEKRIYAYIYDIFVPICQDFDERRLGIFPPGVHS